MNEPATCYESVCRALHDAPATWLVTGVAGFIGSNLLEELLALEQTVIGLDNFATGHRRNLDEVEAIVNPTQWSRFHFVEGDIRSFDDCRRACTGVDRVLHQAALGSVPRSLFDPIATNQTNVDGFVNMLVAAREAKVSRLVYASSSSVYGDHPALPKVENTIGVPLSPYAVTKYVNELYAATFAGCYGFHSIGLRYFNVFGPRQDPNGAYAAVIPKWIGAIISGEQVVINGDGETSRDFTFVDNAVQMNLLAAMSDAPEAVDQVYNVAVGDHTTLNELYAELIQLLRSEFPHVSEVRPMHGECRVGDVRRSQADISKSRSLLGYSPTCRFAEGLAISTRAYLAAATARHAGTRRG